MFSHTVLRVQAEVPTFMCTFISIKASTNHNPSIPIDIMGDSLDESVEVTFTRPMAIPHPTHSVVINSASVYI